VLLDVPGENNSYIDAIKVKEYIDNKPLEYSKIGLKFFKDQN
jgi:hypothetical protein